MNDQIDALKALQMALARLGYYTGAIDGLFGPRTDLQKTGQRAKTCRHVVRRGIGRPSRSPAIQPCEI